ncbi:MAG: extracellular solute-binding protein [Candidatus Sumerlaeota bacterium]|nr:extracellular solute-binding protein [Candidatus Sumerlaeota bacterium]
MKIKTIHFYFTHCAHAREQSAQGAIACTIIYIAICAFFTACGKGSAPKDGAAPEVVVYTALDQLYSEPILKRFEQTTGIRVKAVYDAEAVKTVGLVNRLIAERERPRCDVFWNNEVMRSIVLKDAGILDKFVPANAGAIPPAFKDADGFWTGFAARARVLAWNTKQLTRAELPKTISDLADARWKGRIAMAKPLFGSTATHAGALWALWGESRAQKFFDNLKTNGVVIFDGNMTAARAVADGEASLCLTDSDDVNLLKSEGRPIDCVLLDHDGGGALLIPNAVSLVRGCPHPREASRLIEYLLSPEVEAALAASASAQIPLRPGVEAPPAVKTMAQGPFLAVDFSAAAKNINASADFLKKLF